MNIRFTKGAQALFEKGKISDELVKIKKDAGPIGGLVSVDFTYLKSTLNNSLKCYQYQKNELSIPEQARIIMLKLEEPPPYYCEAEIDLEVTSK